MSAEIVKEWSAAFDIVELFISLADILLKTFPFVPGLTIARRETNFKWLVRIWPFMEQAFCMSVVLGLPDDIRDQVMMAVEPSPVVSQPLPGDDNDDDDKVEDTDDMV